MRHVLGSLPPRNLNLALGDAGPSQRGAQQVSVLVDGVGLNCGQDEVLHELGAKVFDKDLDRRISQYYKLKTL